MRCKKDDGKVWLGEVQRGEPLDHIHETHPYKEAAAFWSPSSQDGCLSTLYGCKKTALISAPYHPALVPEPMSQSGLACTVEPVDDINAGLCFCVLTTHARCPEWDVYRLSRWCTFGLSSSGVKSSSPLLCALLVGWGGMGWDGTLCVVTCL